MAWDVDGWEALSLGVGLIMATLAVVLLRTNRHRPQNRWFGALLTVEAVLAIAGPSIAITTNHAIAGVAATLFMTTISFLVPVYLGFLSTLGTSISRLLRNQALRILPWALPMTAFLSLAFDRSVLVGPADPAVTDLWATVAGPIMPLYQGLYLITALVGMATAVLYWRTSPQGTSMRRQGAVFALAFGLHDGMMIIGVVVGLAAMATQHAVLFSVAYYGIPLSKLVLTSLVTYGILRFQLFDIDLKVKWSLGRGTALALLAATFFVITETIEFMLPGEGLVANLVGAGLVAVLARPAWRLGKRFANLLLPGVVDTEEFRRGRRLDVYRASLESIVADGVISVRERRLLETMRTKLGISPDQAGRIEADLVQAGAQKRDAERAEPTPG